MTFHRANRLEPDRSITVVIDVQQKLLPLIRGADGIVRAAARLLDASRIFQVPVLATEQYPAGIGPTDAAIRAALTRAGAEVLEKTAFSACGDDGIRRALRHADRPQVVLAGIETHVCIQQTALDLRAMDYDVFVCADAVGSRSELDQAVALERMRQEGVYVTTVESAMFEWCRECGTDRFKTMLALVKTGSSPGA